MDKTLIYLATPYSDPDPKVKEKRFLAVNKAAAELMRAGLYVYSPISHSHNISLAGDLPGDWEYWEKYDRLILAICNKMIVLMLPGWKESKGVTNEIRIAKEEFNLDIEYLEVKEENLDNYFEIFYNQSDRAIFRAQTEENAIDCLINSGRSVGYIEKIVEVRDVDFENYQEEMLEKKKWVEDSNRWNNYLKNKKDEKT